MKVHVSTRNKGVGGAVAPKLGTSSRSDCLRPAFSDSAFSLANDAAEGRKAQGAGTECQPVEERGEGFAMDRAEQSAGPAQTARPALFSR